MVSLRLSCLLSVLSGLVLLASAAPDSAGHVPLPGHGLSYGGIPYGSVSGNVAEFFNRHTPSSGRSLKYNSDYHGNSIDYSPIERYL